MPPKKQLYILPFDHRSTFYEGLFGWDLPLDRIQKSVIIKYKKMIWQAFLKVYLTRFEKENFGILVDEEFGSEILKQAKNLGVIRILTVEKSGQETFDFEYGDKFGQHILKFKPEYAKALVRYNPVNKKDNQAQLKRLKKLNDFCKHNEVGFLIELLVPATDEQKQKYKNTYDKKIRFDLTQKAIKEMRDFKIEPDAWKLEAMYKKSDWLKIIQTIKTKNKKEPDIIVLGRNASKKQVADWLKIAAPLKDVNGFVVGRTIFFQALKDYYDKKLTQKEAVKKIAGNFEYFVNLWERYKK